jgi:hypothetical protein
MTTNIIRFLGLLLMSLLVGTADTDLTPGHAVRGAA